MTCRHPAQPRFGLFVMFVFVVLIFVLFRVCLCLF